MNKYSEMHIDALESVFKLLNDLNTQIIALSELGLQIDVYQNFSDDGHSSGMPIEITVNTDFDRGN